MSKTVSMNVRIDPEFRDKWSATCQQAGMDVATVSRELFMAAIRYYERNGNLYAPFEIVAGPRTPEERVRFAVSGHGGVAVNGDNNGHVHVENKGAQMESQPLAKPPPTRPKPPRRALRLTMPSGKPTRCRQELTPFWPVLTGCARR